MKELNVNDHRLFQEINKNHQFLRLLQIRKSYFENIFLKIEFLLVFTLSIFTFFFQFTKLIM